MATLMKKFPEFHFDILNEGISKTFLFCRTCRKMMGIKTS